MGRSTLMVLCHWWGNQHWWSYVIDGEINIDDHVPLMGRSTLMIMSLVGRSTLMIMCHWRGNQHWWSCIIDGEINIDDHVSLMRRSTLMIMCHRRGDQHWWSCVIEGKIWHWWSCVIDGEINIDGLVSLMGEQNWWSYVIRGKINIDGYVSLTGRFDIDGHVSLKGKSKLMVMCYWREDQHWWLCVIEMEFWHWWSCGYVSLMGDGIDVHVSLKERSDTYGHVSLNGRSSIDEHVSLNGGSSNDGHMLLKGRSELLKDYFLSTWRRQGKNQNCYNYAVAMAFLERWHWRLWCVYDDETNAAASQHNACQKQPMKACIWKDTTTITTYSQKSIGFKNYSRI